MSQVFSWKRAMKTKYPVILQSVSRIYPNGRVLDRRLFMKMSALLLSVCPLQSYAQLFSICFSTQYRCKLKNTEGSLRAEERLASDLKSQLREANAAGEATRNVSVEKQLAVNPVPGERTAVPAFPVQQLDSGRLSVSSYG